MCNRVIDVSDYHKNRRMFVIVDDKVYLAPVGDERSHLNWLSGSPCIFGDSTKVCWILNNCVRGYFSGRFSQKLYIYRGVNFESVGAATLDYAINLMIDTIPLGPDVVIYNGMKMGRPGEQWKPISSSGTVSSIINSVDKEDYTSLT